MTERREKIWLATPHMSDEGYEQKFIQEAFDTNWIAPLGPNVERFEQEVAELSGMKHTLALVSGTAAIHLALKAVGVGPGDIVLCQSLTFSASANPIIYEGATPVFIDSDYETWNMDPKYLEQALETYGEKVKAVIVVHLYGLPADLDPIVELCERYGVALVEDAAESLGSTYKGQMTGSFGDYGIYSFNGNKIITTSGGGMVLSNDKERVDKMRFWATQARDKARHYQHSELGYNYRLSNVLAGVGRGQLMVVRILMTMECAGSTSTRFTTVVPPRSPRVRSICKTIFLQRCVVADSMLQLSISETATSETRASNDRR